MLANGIIIYDIVEANLGDAYNPSTGIFTFPVTGYYVFSVFAMSLVSSLHVSRYEYNIFKLTAISRERCCILFCSNYGRFKMIFIAVGIGG